MSKRCSTCGAEIEKEYITLNSSEYETAVYICKECINKMADELKDKECQKK